VKPIKGTIEDWSILAVFNGVLRCEGRIFDHEEMPDGTRITTTEVVCVHHGMVHTQNSRYYLGKMRGERK
jgi:hypothetical protein